jgi:hypothetical protein
MRLAIPPHEVELLLHRDDVESDGNWVEIMQSFLPHHKKFTTRSWSTCMELSIPMKAPGCTAEFVPPLSAFFSMILNTNLTVLR